MCMYTYIYMRRYIHIYIYIIYVDIYIYICIYTYTYVHIYIYECPLDTVHSEECNVKKEHGLISPIHFHFRATVVA